MEKDRGINVKMMSIKKVIMMIGQEGHEGSTLATRRIMVAGYQMTVVIINGASLLYIIGF